jgi:sigma-E factor negative regulatory protein RseA
MPQWLVSGAVAASVTLAVLAGARIVNEQSLSEQAMFAAQQPVKAEVAAPAAPVSQPAMVASTAKSVPAVSAEELSQAQQVLQQYVLEHEEQAAGVAESDPFARVANFGQNGNQAKPR